MTLQDISVIVMKWKKEIKSKEIQESKKILSNLWLML